jgi:opacity protein-like surface antigen
VLLNALKLAGPPPAMEMEGLVVATQAPPPLA